MATSPVHPTAPAGPQPSNPQSAPNVIGFDPKATVPSQTLYVQRNDYIGFNILTNLLNTAVRINYRFLTPQGEIKEGEIDTPVFSGSNFQTIQLYEGWLLSFGARVTQGAAFGQWVFMQAMVFRTVSAGVGTNAHSLFWQGFVGFNAGNGWPGTPAKEITDGPGVIKSIVGTTPAAGVDINEVVPSQRRWTLLCFRALLTTSATVANRFPGFTLDDGANQYENIKANVAQTATQVVNYYLVPSAAFYNDTQANIILTAPGLTVLRAGFRIKTNTNSLQATDQWTAPVYTVLEWGVWDP